MELDLLVPVRLQWQPAAAPESASSRDVMDSPDSSSDGVEEVVRPHSGGGDDSVIVLSSVVDLSSTSSVVDVDELSGSECSIDDDSASDNDEEAMPVQLPTCCSTYCEGAASVVVWQCAHVWCVHCATDIHVHAVQRCPVCRCEMLVE